MRTSLRQAFDTEARVERIALALLKADGYQFAGSGVMASENPRAKHYVVLARIAIEAYEEE
jgi:hypothetical protein